MKQIPNNEIWYTTTNEETLSDFNEYAFDSKLISNTYTNNHGVLVFANDLTIIGESAFALSEKLKSIILPDTIAKIDIGAFSVCENLLEITIPKNVTSIEACAFGLCTKLKKFSGKYASEDGLSLIINGVLNQFALGCKLKEYTIPSEATEIGWSSFSESQLEKVVLHDKIKKIGHSAFCGCVNLYEINIPNNVTSIEDVAFQDCTALKDISIPKSVNLGINVFEGCNDVSVTYDDESIGYSKDTDLKQLMAKYTSRENQSEGYVYSGDESAKIIHIPDGVSLIKSDAFEDCQEVEVIYIPSSVKEVEDGAFCGLNNLCRFVSDNASEDGRCLIIKNTLFGFAGKDIYQYTLPNNITNIAPMVFGYNRDLRSIDISDGVRKIGYQVFWMCENLERITLPNSLKVIEESAMGGCESLKNIIIPDSVKVIEDAIFYDCTQLEEVTLPSNLLAINGSIFSGCVNLKKINSPLITKDGGGLIIDGVLVDYIGLNKNNEFVIPNGVSMIANNAFHGNKYIKNIIIPESVTKIGSGAFHSCNNLVSVEFTSSTPPNFGAAAFYANAYRFSIFVPTGAKKQYRKALKHADIDAIIFDKSKENSEELFQEIIYGNNYDEEISAEKLLSIGIDCYHNNDIEGSIAVFEKLIALKGFKDDYPYNSLIHIYKEREDVENEKRILSLAIENLPDIGHRLHEYRLRLGKLYAGKKDIQMPTFAVKCQPEIRHGELYEQELFKLPEFNFKPYDSPLPSDWYEREKVMQPVGNIIDYFRRLIEEAEIARSKKDHIKEAQIYERIIAEKYWKTSPYDKLIKLYSRAKLYDEEIRVLKLSIEHFSILHAERYEYIMKLAEKYDAYDYIEQRNTFHHGRICYYVGWLGEIVLYEPFPIIKEWKIRLEKKLNRRK